EGSLILVIARFLIVTCYAMEYSIFQKHGNVRISVASVFPAQDHYHDIHISNVTFCDSRQPPAGASNDDKPLFEIPATTTLADIVQLIRETYHARSNRQDKTDKQIAALNDKINHPRRRSNSISSSASDASDRDIIRTNNDPQQTPTRTPKLPTPTPQIKTPIAQIPSPFPQAFTPVLQSRNLVQLPRPRAVTDADPHTTPSLRPKDYLQSILYFDGTPMCYDAREFIIHQKY
ncbi:hypothetical protein PV326_012759, partial [Microctonus aethiopoides]